MVAFLVGDYASEILRLGPLSTSIYAALTIIILTAVNVAGIRQGKWTQKTFVAFILLGLFVASAIGILMAGQQTVFPDGNVIPRKESLGTAMIFVLLTYGGWNEASFLSAEVRSGRHNMLKVLIYSIGVVMVIYLLVNIALLKNLGRPDMAASSTVMADMIGKMFGKVGSNLTSLLILIAAVSTMNAAIITGARTSYALGQDYSILGFLGRWHGLRHTPVNALLLQGGIVLVLVVLGTGTHDGFVMMVEYTAPVFWLFFLMVGVSIFLLRHKEPNAHRPFMIPLYPLPLLVFCAICLFMLYSSVAFTRGGSFIGVCVLLTGTPLMILQKKRRLKDKNILTKLNERDAVEGGKHDQSDR
jgi:amino acid transporter